jgi:hypothetical protein
MNSSGDKEDGGELSDLHPFTKKDVRKNFEGIYRVALATGESHSL